MEAASPLHIYRDPHFAPAGDTVVAAAPLDVVVDAYGGGGLVGEAGLSAAFGGAIVFKNHLTGACFLGIWGKRNAARFKAALEAQGDVEVIDGPPPARLQHFSKTGRRPKHTR